MTTYNIREFKSKVSEILSNLKYGEEVIITRRGKPRGRLSLAQNPSEEKSSLSTLRGSFAYLPDATYQDFQEVKALWEPLVPATDTD